MKINQKGFSVVEILIVIVVIGLLGAVGWLVYDQQKTKTSESPKTTQVEEIKKEESITPAQNTQPKENATTLKVGSYSLELNIPDTLKDLAVGSSRDSTFEGRDFTQATLVTDKFKNCTSQGGVLGSIYKVGGTYSTYPFGTPDETKGVYIKQLDSFYLMFQGPQSYQCGDLDASSTHAQVKQAIIDSGWIHKTK